MPKYPPPVAWIVTSVVTGATSPNTAALAVPPTMLEL